MACHGTERIYFSDVCLIQFSKNRENLCHKQCYICLAFPAIYECVYMCYTHIHTPSPYSTKKKSNIFQAYIHFFSRWSLYERKLYVPTKENKTKRRENPKANFIWISPTKPFNCIFYRFDQSIVQSFTGYLYLSPKRAIKFRLAGAHCNGGNSNMCCICYCLNWT